MDFFGNTSGAKRAQSVALIDIGSKSVAGAYARYIENMKPILLYVKRVPIIPHSGESESDAMLRAFDVLGDDLIREGAPVLARATGRGNVNAILVSIDAPWQKTSMYTKHFEKKESFFFTRSLVSEVLREKSDLPVGKVLVDESIVGINLNGYETSNPYGKRARRASITILSSAVDIGIMDSIEEKLGRLYHSHNCKYISGCSLRYQSVRAAFPHERDAIILDATESGVTILLERKGFLVAVSEMLNQEKGNVVSWDEKISRGFIELAKQFPLPRTIFLITRDADVTALRKTLEKTDFSTLWLSDNPPKLIQVLSSHFSSEVNVPPESSDIILMLMTLYYQQRDVMNE